MGVGERRSQRLVMRGMVIKSIPVTLWRVRWECYDRASDRNALQEGRKEKSSATVEELSTLDVESNHLGNVDKLWSCSGSRSNDFLNVVSQPTSQTFILPPRPDSPMKF